MILILSDKFDQSTNKVIDWLIGTGASFFRINENDLCEIVQINIGVKSNVKLKVKNHIIDFDKVTSYWYRRGEFKIKELKKVNNSKLDVFDKEISKNLKEEIITITEFINLFLREKKSLGSYFDNFTNKLGNLRLANLCGLKIPETIISSNIQNIKEFKNKIEGDIITKAISQTIMFSKEEGAIQAYTNKVDEGVLNNYKKSIFPSLFQEGIDKKYELRIFFIEQEFYAMAIFSQSNKKTKFDFRNYDRERPNRCVPYLLPKDIQNKLISFINKKNLKSGSIDMIVTVQREYVFLEVNPVGQFGMTSFPCNYYLNKKIAQYLCEKN